MSNRELLFRLTRKDFEVQTFRSGGPGGQHQNKTSSGVRVIHRASGAVSESREHRSQPQNRKAAFLRLVETPEFQRWHKRMVAEMSMDRQGLERRVDEWMRPEHLKIECGEEAVR